MGSGKLFGRHGPTLQHGEVPKKEERQSIQTKVGWRKQGKPPSETEGSFRHIQGVSYVKEY